MIFVYGSQNFGYDLEESDEDYMQFIIPQWDDIIHGKMLSTEINNGNSIIKVKDIRKISSMIQKPNFSDLQWMWGKPMDDCSLLDWFIKNSNDLIYCNVPYLCKSSLGIIRSNLELKTAKGLTRAFVYKELLIDVCSSSFSGIKYEDKFKTFRRTANFKENTKWFNDTSKDILLEAEEIELAAKDEFEINQELMRAADMEIWKILKTKIL